MMEEKAKKRHVIPGTKLANNNTQLLVSSGIPTLDDIIGGGLAVGTVFLIEEDTCGTYSKVMLQYFLAEGIVSGHSLYVASHDIESKSLVKNLPAVIEDTEEVPKVETNDDKLTIAWRYQNMSTNKVKLPPKFGHYYDLTKSMDSSTIKKVNITYWTPKDHYEPMAFTFKNPAYHDLLQDIKQKIDEGQYALTSNPNIRSVLRVALHSLGSPLWLPNGEYGYSSHLRDLDMFLYCIRAIARLAFVVIAVTIPSKLVDENSVARCIHSSDLAVRLQAFAGTDLEKNNALSDYQGFFHFVKFPTINCLVSKDPGPVDYAFKLRRKKFNIGELHLPPELQDSCEREQDELPTLGCGSSTKHLLEF